MTWSGTTCTGTAAFFSHEEALRRGQSQTGWRLPNVKELASIVDRSRVSPAADPVAFPGTPPEWTWTSTPYAGEPQHAWVVGFDYGVVVSGDRAGRFSGGTSVGYVTLRLVR